MLKDSKFDKFDIEKILLVGSASKMPKLRNMIYNYFDQELSLDDVLHDD